MPIFEFRCSECGHIFEQLFVSSNETISLACPRCGCQALDRVVSKTNYAIGAGSGPKGPSVTANTCPSGSCMTMEFPGPAK
jgi:putative FmdB family regulatory protein